MELSDYPLLTHHPQMQHCAFGFQVFTRIKELGEKIKEGDSIETLYQKYAEANKELENKFPSTEEFEAQISAEEKRDINEFTGLEDRVVYHRRVEGNGDLVLTISHLSTPFAPVIGLKISSGFLESELHNGAAPQLAAAMWPHGLRAIQTIYKAYGKETDFLPSMKFTSEGLYLRAPFPVLAEQVSENLRKGLASYMKNVRFLHKLFPEEERFGEVKIESDRLKVNLEKVIGSETQGEFRAHIPIQSKKKYECASIAAHMAVIASYQSHSLYRQKLREKKE